MPAARPGAHLDFPRAAIGLDVDDHDAVGVIAVKSVASRARGAIELIAKAIDGRAAEKFWTSSGWVAEGHSRLVDNLVSVVQEGDLAPELGDL